MSIEVRVSTSISPYGLVSQQDVYIGPHTSKWPMSNRPLLMFLSFGNGCRCCLPNWHAPHTPLISFFLNVGSLMTTPFDCIPLSFWRLIWLILLCHSSMSVSVLRPFENMADFTSFDSRISIWPSLWPCVMSRPSFSMMQPPWLNRTCIPCSTIWLTETNSSLWWEHAIRFLCKFVHLLSRTGHFRHVDCGEWYHHRSRHSRVDPALEGLGTIHEEMSYG